MKINNYSEGWKDIHETAQHDLAICCNKEKVRILEEFYLLTVISLPVSMEICSEKILLVLGCHPPRQQVSTFME